MNLYNIVDLQEENRKLKARTVELKAKIKQHQEWGKDEVDQRIVLQNMTKVLEETLEAEKKYSQFLVDRGEAALANEQHDLKNKEMIVSGLKQELRDLQEECSENVLLAKARAIDSFIYEKDEAIKELRNAAEELIDERRHSGRLVEVGENALKALDTRNVRLESEIDKFSGELAAEIVARRRIELALAEKEKELLVAYGRQGNGAAREVELEATIATMKKYQSTHILRAKADGLELGRDSDRKACEAWAKALRKSAQAQDQQADGGEG